MSTPINTAHGPIIVAGMHRSGTSLTASVLEKAGVFIGETLEPGNVGNPLGHFEDVEILSLHRDILIAQGISQEGWTRQVSLEVPQQFLHRINQFCEKRLVLNQVWGWKEPRTTLFLDFWEGYLPEAKFILPYRSPWEVVDSLFRRGDEAFRLNPSFAIDVWLAYNQGVIGFYQRHADKCLLLNSKTFSENENLLIEKISEKFEISLHQVEDGLFKAELMHTEVSNTHRQNLLTSFFPGAIDLYLELERVADLPSAIDTKANLIDTSGQSYRDWMLQDWSSHRRVQRELKITCAESDHRQNQISALQSDLHKQLETVAQVQHDLEQVKHDLRQTQEEHNSLLISFGQTEQSLRQVQNELAQTKTELAQAKTENQMLQSCINAMESSKFWKLRHFWFQIKEVLKIGDGDRENI